MVGVADKFHPGCIVLTISTKGCVVVWAPTGLHSLICDVCVGFHLWTGQWALHTVHTVHNALSPYDGPMGSQPRPHGPRALFCSILDGCCTLLRFSFQSILAHCMDTNETEACDHSLTVPFGALLVGVRHI